MKMESTQRTAQDIQDTNFSFVNEMLDDQRQKWEKSLEEMLDSRFSHFSQCIFSDIRAIREETREVHAKTCALDQTLTTTLKECSKTKQRVTELERAMTEIVTRLEEKFDKLDTSTRRNNLKFFNVQLSNPNESFDQCISAVLYVLSDCVKDKVWSRSDITDVYRLGRYNDNRGRPPPIIVKFATLSDKMLVLTSGREALRRKSVTVAADLTDKQRYTILEYRRQGVHAYYKGNRLVVADQRNQFDHSQRRGRQRHYNNDNYGSYPHEHRTDSYQSSRDIGWSDGTQSSSWNYDDQQFHQHYQANPLDYWSMQQYPSLPAPRNANLIVNNDRQSETDTGRPLKQTVINSVMPTDSVTDQTQEETQPCLSDQSMIENDVLTANTEIDTTEKDQNENRQNKKNTEESKMIDPTPTSTELGHTDVQTDNEIYVTESTSPPHANIEDNDEMNEGQTDTTETADQPTLTVDPENVSCTDQSSTDQLVASSTASAARSGPLTRRQRSASCTSVRAKRQATLHETTRKQTNQSK